VETNDYFRRKRIGGIASLLGAVGAIAAVSYRLIYPEPPISRTYADGIYRNQQCGTITFRAGTVSFGKTYVKYELERLKDSVAAITPHWLGVETYPWGCRVEYDDTESPMYLSFGGDEPPRSVTLWGSRQHVSYRFVRENPKPALGQSIQP